MDFEVIASDCGFLEGPIITPAGDIIVTSIDRGLLYQVSADGEVSVLANTGGGANGATLGADGTVYVAQNGGIKPGVPGVHRGEGPSPPSPDTTGGVQAASPQGEVRWITRDMVAPNDICIGPDGWLWVTDPTRRVHPARKPARGDDGRLWRCNPENGLSQILTSVDWYPNGLGFGPDADALYVANTFMQTIERLPLLDEDLLGPAETFIQMEYGLPDGFAFDEEGNLLIGVVSLEGDPGELQVWDAKGALLDRIRPAQSTIFTNVALSPDRLLVVTEADEGRIFVCRDWPTRGLPMFPFR